MERKMMNYLMKKPSALEENNTNVRVCIVKFKGFENYII
jgi:hypothetical protein